ncbi:MAG: glycogen/starch/alpha-glucan family phosphorylase [Blautia sp.]|uniref:glycogen/starch/alpha-glucan phosphorylase n=1 Tax=Blautia sp. TaxID=1955243 RepID=UPI0025BB3350|nr:glycogen/starch/alpha-glucan phosphorylase [Blautia sp.]MCI6301685.1 glycogen/starch/alpha-glucan family phosphorylase [Blautia sp.]MDD6415419.1 glycogen/starch/alpha-glucan phosphorylase [Blautia sp.]MDY4115198.1 glycogen/starch/alpha-glucan phosphorylase [Blautia sp.]
MENLEKLIYDLYKKNVRQCTNEEIYNALLIYTKNQLFEKGYQDGKKKIYYISAEFLIGKLLSNNLINLGIYDDVAAFLKENGKAIADIEEVEPEPSLGNGGLGRLAACFLDSIATLGLPGEGIGLNYHLGLFKQLFEDRLQKETPNPWIEEHSWLTPAGVSYTVPFRGFSLKSSLYDIDVAGYNNKSIHLHLFDIDIADESIVKDGISFDKKDILHNLTLFLYPDDSDDDGRKLRIFQQYFMVSNAAQFILDEATKKGCNLHDLADYAVIQINDTHPSMVIPELIRLLTERGIDFDEAAEIVSKVCAYTNHTILAEALEKWPMDYLLDVVPHLVPIIEKLDEKIKEKYPQENVAIIDKNNLVHMAHMDIHYGFSINGVAALHTEILKTSELKAFYDIYPEKFNNKTNGITFRRWLMHCNHPLTDYITELIGDEFKKDANALENLLKYKDDEAVLNKILEIKTEAKKTLKDFILSNTGVEIDENSIYDIQIKRLHEYKRQQLNALYIISKYLEIKGGKKPAQPVTFIFGAKAAPAYVIAKDIIHLLLTLQDLIKDDPEVAPYMKLVMVENYNVSAAEKLIPACDISEQISLASKEASGTGNMKFMLNGAVTLGTMDGANVEISELVGEDNIYIFGESSEKVIEHYEKADYCSKDIYESDEHIKECVDFIVSEKMLKLGHKENLERLHHELVSKDWFMTLLDFNDYVEKKDQALSDYADRKAWAKKMLVNIAKAGFFSSDRTIEQYNNDIWHLTPAK